MPREASALYRLTGSRRLDLMLFLPSSSFSFLPSSSFSFLRPFSFPSQATEEGQKYLALIDSAVAGGVTMVVLEASEAGQESAGQLFESACCLKEVLRGRAPLLIWERADIAAAAGAEGVLLSDRGVFQVHVHALGKETAIRWNEGKPCSWCFRGCASVRGHLCLYTLGVHSRTEVQTNCMTSDVP